MANLFRRVRRFDDGHLSRCRLLGNETSFRLLFWFVNGKRLNLDFPETFNEKPQWLKLHDGNQLYQVMVYKLIAKEWATNRIGNRYIISTLAIWDNVDGIDLNDLPEQFVLKTNHGSGTAFACKDRVDFDFDKAKIYSAKKLTEQFFYQLREWPHKGIVPQVFAESFIGDVGEESFPNDVKNSSGLTDYKLLCYDGVCGHLFTRAGRESGDPRVDFF